MAMVTSASINLANSLVLSTTPGSILVKLGVDTYNWLQRERIDEASFNRCMDLAVGVALPNSNGEVIQETLRASEKNLRAAMARAPLGLRVAGSLGRALARDIETSYLVSTVAALGRHRTTAGATDVLTEFILTRPSLEATDVYFTMVQRAPVRAVVAKLVDSVFLNVVNAGHNVATLPDPLVQLCPHLTSVEDFAKIIHRVENWQEDLIVVRSSCFVADVTLWLYNHFHGIMIVSVNGDILLEQELGTRRTTVHIMIDGRCTDTSNLHQESSEVSVLVSLQALKGPPWNVVQGRVLGYRQQEPMDITRRPLYDLQPGNLERNECMMILAVAKQIVAWLLELHVPKTDHVNGTKLKVHVDTGPDTPAQDRRPLTMLLPRYPSIMHLNTGSLNVAKAAVRGKDNECYEAAQSPNLLSATLPRTPSIERLETPGAFPLMTELAWFFPVIEDLTDKMSVRCTCLACKSERRVFDCAYGCLRFMALLRLYTLIAHAICDAAGVDDAAALDNMHDTTFCAKAAVKVLLNVVVEGEIDWEAWLELIGATAAGFPVSEHTETPNGEIAKGDGTMSAIQYGSYTIVASWLDITKPIGLFSALGVEVFDAAISGIPDDIGIVFAEDGAASEATKTDGWIGESMVASEDLSDDTIKAELVTAIFRTGDIIYRRMVSIKAEKQITILDPARVTAGLVKSATPSCRHRHQPCQELLDTCQILEFNQTLSRWYARQVEAYRQDGRLNRNHKFVLSMIIDSMLKLNVLVGKTTAGAVIRYVDRCCLECAQVAVSDVHSTELVPIINLSAGLSRTEGLQLMLSRA